MVSTHLKNISQIGSFPQIGVKIKNIWNHHLAVVSIDFFLLSRLQRCPPSRVSRKGWTASRRSRTPRSHREMLNPLKWFCWFSEIPTRIQKNMIFFKRQGICDVELSLFLMIELNKNIKIKIRNNEKHALNKTINIYYLWKKHETSPKWNLASQETSMETCNSPFLTPPERKVLWGLKPQHRSRLKSSPVPGVRVFHEMMTFKLRNRRNKHPTWWLAFIA